MGKKKNKKGFEFIYSSSTWNTVDEGIVNMWSVMEESGRCSCEMVQPSSYLNSAYIRRVYTEPYARRMGCASQMIKYCEDIAKTNYMKTILISVDKLTYPDDPNAGSVLEFYEQLGYTVYYESEESYSLIKIL